MSVLSFAIASALPRPTMDPDTVKSITAGLARIERRERAESIAKPMREEFDATVARIADIPPGQITSAIRTTEIAWEIEKLQREDAV